MNTELLKSQYRFQSSLLNVNKRLEDEIFKLKSSLSEQTARNAKLVEQVEFFKNKEHEANRTQLFESIRSIQSQLGESGLVLNIDNNNSN
jgi:hypothetical protein